MFSRTAALASGVFLLWVAPAQPQEARIESARQFNAATATPYSTATSLAPSPSALSNVREDDSFGDQQILQAKERERPFRAFADVSAFATDNVALTRDDARKDAFLVATFGFEYRRALPAGVQLELGVRAATFRYNRFSELDFNSVDVGVGLSYRFGGIDFFARYNFNELIAAEENQAFFKNHTFTVGAQKTFVLNERHSLYAGVAGQLASSDPKLAERSELSGFVGYHAQVIRNLEADLLYRYAYVDYTEQDRADHSHTISFGLSYHFTDWCTLSASSYAAWNRSDQEVFNYDVANVGGGLTLSAQF